MMERFTFNTTAIIEGHTLSGVAHVFGQRTLQAGRYIEFDAAAFDKALATSDARAFLNHNTDLLLGRQSAGTLRIGVEGGKLNYSIDLPDTSYARDLQVLVDRGDMNEMSFGIVPGAIKTYKAEDGKTVQRHTEVREFFDVSPVSMPAFGGTSAQLHSLSLDGETALSQTIRARQRARTITSQGAI